MLVLVLVLMPELQLAPNSLPLLLSPPRNRIFRSFPRHTLVSGPKVLMNQIQAQSQLFLPNSPTPSPPPTHPTPQPLLSLLALGPHETSHSALPPALPPTPTNQMNPQKGPHPPSHRCQRTPPKPQPTALVPPTTSTAAASPPRANPRVAPPLGERPAETRGARHMCTCMRGGL